MFSEYVCSAVESCSNSRSSLPILPWVAVRGHFGRHDGQPHTFRTSPKGMTKCHGTDYGERKIYGWSLKSQGISGVRTTATASWEQQWDLHAGSSCWWSLHKSSVLHFCPVRLLYNNSFLKWPLRWKHRVPEIISPKQHKMREGHAQIPEIDWALL